MDTVNFSSADSPVVSIEQPTLDATAEASVHAAVMRYIPAIIAAAGREPLLSRRAEPATQHTHQQPFATYFGPDGEAILTCTLELVRVLELFPNRSVQERALIFAAQLRDHRDDVEHAHRRATYETPPILQPIEPLTCP